MRNALYARQSVDKKDSISIETQLEKAEAECGPDDLIMKYVDRGYSGKNTKRPDYQRLMEDVKKGLIDRVIVYKLDRFSRSILDFSNAWEILSHNKVEFSSVNEKFDTSTPIGKAMLYITIVFAQMERETTAERVTDNYYERITYGSWPGGPAPYGYGIGRLQKPTPDGKTSGVPTLKANDNMDAVRMLFERYAQPGLSLGALAQILNTKGFPAPKRAAWNNVTLSRILKNPVYAKMDVDMFVYFERQKVKIVNDVSEFTGERAGMLIGKRSAATRERRPAREAVLCLANWPGVIPSSVWLLCQEKLAENEQIKNTGKGKYTWLSGLLKCGYCKRAFRVIADPKYPDSRLLYCSGRTDHICDKKVRWHICDIEQMVERELLRLLEQFQNEPAEEVIEVSNAYKIELKELEEKADHLLQNLSNAKVSAATMELINAEIDRLNQRKAALLEEIAQNAGRHKVHYEEIDFRGIGFEEKKLVARSYISRVEVFEEGIQIEWKI